MDAADTAWEEAVERYEAYLQTIRPDLPASVRQLLDGFYLHDANVLSMGRQGNTFIIVLQLDVPPHDLLPERLGVRIVRVLETHTHADHISGHGRLALEHAIPVSVHGDAAALEHLFADDLVVVVPGMRVMTKADAVGMFTSGRIV